MFLLSFNLTTNWINSQYIQDSGLFSTLKENYNRPTMLSENYYEMLVGLYVQAAQKVDMLFSQTVSS